MRSRAPTHACTQAPTCSTCCRVFAHVVYFTFAHHHLKHHLYYNHTRPLTPLSRRTRAPSRPHRYQSQGRFEETQIILLEALRGMRELLPEDHLDISRGLCNLAKLYETTSETLGLQAEAEPLYLESLAMMVCE